MYEMSPWPLLLIILTGCQSKQTVMLAPARIRPAGTAVQMRSSPLGAHRRRGQLASIGNGQGLWNESLYRRCRLACHA